MNKVNDYFIVIMRIILGAIFLWASFDKILDLYYQNLYPKLKLNPELFWVQVLLA